MVQCGLGGARRCGSRDAPGSQPGGPLKKRGNAEPASWGELIRACAERFGWPPAVVLELTPLEAAILLGAKEPTGRRTVWLGGPQQVRQYQAALAAKAKMQQ